MELITCPRCGATANAVEATEYPRLYITSYGDTPGAIVHRRGALNDHITLPGKCAGGGRWGIGPCTYTAKETVTRNGVAMPLCGTHANRERRYAARFD